MRVFAISDIHIDFRENYQWLHNLSREDYQNDIMILAGDVVSKITELFKVFIYLNKIFKEVLFVPGNHDLWIGINSEKNSIEKFDLIRKIAVETGIIMNLKKYDSLTIVPLFGWYDFSFKKPSKELREKWGDFSECAWPNGFDEVKITNYFVNMNKEAVNMNNEAMNIKNRYIISFSHFMPRIDLMPIFIPYSKRELYPVLGTFQLEKQIRQLDSNIHIYGHSHVNRNISKNGIRYINNAFGYPHETIITAKKLICVYEAI